MPYVEQTILTAQGATVAGDFTPGAAFSMATIAAMVNKSWNAAMKAEYDYNLKLAALTDPTTGLLALSSTPQISGVATASTPTVTEPTVSIPTSIDTTTILTDYDTEYNKLMALMVTKFTGFMTAYFPSDQADYNKVEAWISGAIDNPNGGLPGAVQAQILSDDRARISAESTQAIDTIDQEFAARRYALPPGAMASAHLQIHQKEQSLMAEAGRKVTMLSVEMMKFAIQTALSMRQIALDKSLEYVKELIMAPQITSGVIGMGLDSQTKLIGAVSGFIGARTEVAKLASSVDQFNVSTSLQVKEKNQMATMTTIESQLKAFLAHLTLLAAEVQSGLNNMHVSGGTSYGVNGT